MWTNCISNKCVNQLWGFWGKKEYFLNHTINYQKCIQKCTNNKTVYIKIKAIKLTI